MIPLNAVSKVAKLLKTGERRLSGTEERATWFGGVVKMVNFMCFLQLKITFFFLKTTLLKSQGM